ncbi:hypothetical protein B5F40_04200 [Gordonibacter sp. An230]|uniref:glycosyltransferase family 2 protein n=1 Tax=Gordonibacter sp. An230 TaxID=1965592 RepID=UPI000B3A7572|nr:glycosyltransferase family 2 protein [Gordonibacter sp. An230]OUO91313.1 hypothetical protein B5F40_04200 [Gordonibacter sp. An230]
MDFSLIVPCYNEAQNIRTFFATATECLDAAGLSYELVFVDDGSSDGTMAVVRAEIDAYRRARPGGRGSFTAVRLSRNFGKESALYAGLERAGGAYVGFIDADMQQDPAVALKMMRFLRDHDEFDCVAAVQDRRHESMPMRLFKGMFYRLFNSMSELRIVANASDFRVFRRPVADALLSMREQFRFSKGLFSWVGFDTYVMPYEVHDRLAGTSRWTVRKLFSYAWNGVLAFSTWPLKAIMWIGMILALVSLVLLGMDVYQNTVSSDPLSMSQTLLEVVLLLGGVQMFVLGVIGEYVARAYVETKRRPVYIAREEFVSRATPVAGELGSGSAVIEDAGAVACPRDGAGRAADAVDVEEAVRQAVLRVLEAQAHRGDGARA